MSKQTVYNVGIYVRLSQEDMRAGESLSIENQKLILTKYVTEQGWNIWDIYVDDGYSGTDFNRPGVTRLLEDAKTGKINLIIVKDLSRFGRNYIQVGQYIDYIFPTYNIRFIALNDNVDTANKDNSAMDLMPIVNLFNEWHSASTSKKIKSVFAANAKAGKYKSKFAAYGYVKADDEKHMPIIDPEAAEVVRRIFTMRSQGISPYHIAEALNADKIPIPMDYIYAKIGKTNPHKSRHLWCQSTVRGILNNQIYLGILAQQKTTTVSHKNHKSVKKDPADWVIIENNHEAIISRELWDKCREMENSVSRGKRTKLGIVRPLSGLMYCADCGYKLKLAGKNVMKNGEKIRRDFYNCSSYSMYGKGNCSSHYIWQTQIEAIVLEDIRSMAKLVVEDEETARRQFLTQKEHMSSRQTASEQKHLREIQKRLEELEQLIPSIYEDKVLGKVSESMSIKLLDKYEAEQKELSEKSEQLETKINSAKQCEDDVEEFICRLKKYTDIQELTREICLELIEYITVDKYAADRPREIHIYYKLLDKPLADKTRITPANGDKALKSAG